MIFGTIYKNLIDYIVSFKICKKCKKIKKYNKFYKRGCDKYRNICKECHKKERIEYYYDTINVRKIRRMSYYFDNKEKENERSQIYNNDNIIGIEDINYNKNTCPENIRSIIESMLIVRKAKNKLKEIENVK